MMFLKRYIFFLLCLPCLAQAKNITVSRLTCEMQEGLVLVEAYPRLGWTWSRRRMGRGRLLMRLRFGKPAPDVWFGIRERSNLRKAS